MFSILQSGGDNEISVYCYQATGSNNGGKKTRPLELPIITDSFVEDTRFEETNWKLAYPSARGICCEPWYLTLLAKDRIMEITYQSVRDIFTKPSNFFQTPRNT